MELNELRQKTIQDLEIQKTVVSSDDIPAGRACAVVAARFGHAVYLGGILGEYRVYRFFMESIARLAEKKRKEVSEKLFQSDLSAVHEDEAHSIWEASLAMFFASGDAAHLIRAVSVLDELLYGQIDLVPPSPEVEVTAGALDLIAISRLAPVWGVSIPSSRALGSIGPWLLPKLKTLYQSMVDQEGLPPSPRFCAEYDRIVRADAVHQRLLHGMRFVHVFLLSLVRQSGSIERAIEGMFEPESKTMDERRQ